jgi:hypothetical protein
MNPITLIGAGAALLVLTYTHYVAYSAGEQSVQSAWDRDVRARQEELSKYKDKLIQTERLLVTANKEVQDARAREAETAAKALAQQRDRVAAATRSLRDSNAELAKRFAAQSNDSTALAECKTAGAGFRSVFDRCVKEYQELGDRAQVRLADAIATGLECERSYDAAERALRAFSTP